MIEGKPRVRPGFYFFMIISTFLFCAYRDSNKLAKGLQNLGVKKGDRVAVSLGNNIEFATVSCECIL